MDIKPANVLVSNSHYKHEELENTKNKLQTRRSGDSVFKKTY